MIWYLANLKESWGSSPGLRAALAGASAFLFVLFFGRWFIPWLQAKQFLDVSRKGDSAHLDDLHAHKSRTPTLGGIVWFAGVLGAVLLWARLDSTATLLLSGYVLALAVLGFFDDFKKLRTRRKGIRGKTKLFWQILLAALIGIHLFVAPPEVRFPGVSGNATNFLFLPIGEGIAIPLGAGFILLVILVTTGSSNAVNLTDGLDGLATGCSLIVGGTFTALALLAGDESASLALHIPYVAEGSEVAVFLSALVGGGFGFLWFNCHPAQIFMGDTGSLPLGGALGLAAVLCRQEILLFLAGGVLVAEAASVMLQVGYFKLTTKRIFLCAPLHHHFQFKGWSETKVTVRFWIVGTLLAIISFLILVKL